MRFSIRFRITLTTGTDKSPEHPTSPNMEANGAGQFEKADRTHIGFAEPYWPPDDRSSTG